MYGRTNNFNIYIPSNCYNTIYLFQCKNNNNYTKQNMEAKYYF